MAEKLLERFVRDNWLKMRYYNNKLLQLKANEILRSSFLNIKNIYDVYLITNFICRNGVYIISLRSVLELQAYLKEEFEDLKECTLCMEIVTSDVCD